MHSQTTPKTIRQSLTSEAPDQRPGKPGISDRSGDDRPAVSTTDFSRRPFGRCGLLPPAATTVGTRLGKTG